MLFVALATARAHSCKIDGRALVQCGCWCCFGVLFEVLVLLRAMLRDRQGGMQVTARAQFCKLKRIFARLMAGRKEGVLFRGFCSG